MNLATNSNSVPRSLEILLETAHRTLSYQDRAVIIPLIDNVVNDCRRRRKIMDLIQETLSEIRLNLKYVMFDLDATRRERDEYKERLGL